VAIYSTFTDFYNVDYELLFDEHPREFLKLCFSYEAIAGIAVKLPEIALLLLR